MSILHFLNVLEGDCNIIEHDSGRISVIDVSNGDNEVDTAEEKRKKESEERKEMLKRTNVPIGKIDYKQKSTPDNPINYLKNNIVTNSIFRFIITHPDMDHLDGVKDLYEEFNIANTWDTTNNKKILSGSSFGGYSKDDWTFYTKLRDGTSKINKRNYYAGKELSFFTEDDIKILCPTPTLVQQANESSGDYHDLSYVLLFTPPKTNGQTWKIIFGGDSSNDSWKHILKIYKNEVSNIDILFAPHHGRGSGRNFEFLKDLKPRVTLFGNASSEFLAYSSYPKDRITNNQAGYVIMDISLDKIDFYVKHRDFAVNFSQKRSFATTYNSNFKAWYIGSLK